MTKERPALIVAADKVDEFDKQESDSEQIKRRKELAKIFRENNLS